MQHIGVRPRFGQQPSGMSVMLSGYVSLTKGKESSVQGMLTSSAGQRVFGRVEARDVLPQQVYRETLFQVLEA